MNTQDDVEALLSAVRTLVASRDEESADPLMLTADQRVDPVSAPTSVGDGYILPEGDAVLRDFARLTLVSAPDIPAPLTDAVGGAARGRAEPDLVVQRALIRELLSEDAFIRAGPRFDNDIRRIMQEELDRHLGRAGGD